ncbi:LacI family DNA-binding transcriptional regulator [Epidermidibacterium keratini]
MTLQDVADAAELSKAATSYAMRGIKSAPHTQRRVQQIAREMGYHANRAAQVLAGGRTGVVAISASMRDMWQQGLVVMLAEALREHEYSVRIADVDADPHREADFLATVAREADGLLCLPADPTGSHWSELPDEVSVVCIGDTLIARPSAASVQFNNASGVRTAVEHLAALGHRAITVLTPNLLSTPGRAIEDDVLQAGQRTGTTITLQPVPPSSRGASKVVATLLERRDRPTAVMCLSDSSAFGVYRAAREVALTIPNDLSVLGYDDNELAGLVDPPLSTFGWDEDAIVASAIEALLACISGQAPKSTVFAPEFISRGSSAAPPAR